MLRDQFPLNCFWHYMAWNGAPMWYFIHLDASKKTPSPRIKNEDWIGSGWSQASSENGSWWELVTVNGTKRMRAICKDKSSSMNITWSLRASFSTFWEWRPSSLKAHRVSVLNGLSHTKRITWLNPNESSLKNGADIFMLFLYGVQLILVSNVLIAIRWMSHQSMPSVVWGRWICWWLAVLLRCSCFPQLPSVTPKNPPPSMVCCICVCILGKQNWRCGMNRYLS